MFLVGVKDLLNVIMSFASFGGSAAARPDEKLDLNIAEAKQTVDIQELVNPVTAAEEDEMVATIRHYFNKYTGTSVCHMCGNYVDSHKSSRIDTSVTSKGKKTMTLVFHAGCTPLLWQSLLGQVARKQKYPVCRGTEDEDDLATKVAHTLSPLLQ